MWPYKERYKSTVLAAGGFAFGFFPVETLFSFAQKPYGTRSSEFTVYIGIPALHAFFAKVDAMFHALKRGFRVRMVDTFSHIV
jgi:hypothetical protein